MKIDTNSIYRYGRPYTKSNSHIDGYKNYFYYTQTTGENKPLLDSGINPISITNEGSTVPAILIHSNPFKSGSKDTPWMDFIDNDNGYVRYAGDNKPGSDNPNTTGNISLIKQFELQKSNRTIDRKSSCPIIVFENVKVGNKRKGYKKFLGFGIIEKVERVIEFHKESYYPNYVFIIMIMDMMAENDTFDWDWISARRKNEISLEESHKLAPYAWKKWVNGEIKDISNFQRKIYKSRIVKESDQKDYSKKQKKILEEIKKYYEKKHNDFEYLAAFVTEEIITGEGNNYITGWICKGVGDGGIDFVGKIKISNSLSLVDIVVLGQAKCIKPENSVSGKDIARTVARLKRGWIGSFVTTGIFSKKVQEEIYNDKYPLMLINGKLIADTISKYMHENNIRSVKSFLQKTDDRFQSMRSGRSFDEIVYM